MIKNSKKRKDFRRKQAEERDGQRNSISHQQQLEKLDRLFGKGQGAKKERAKLVLRISEEKQQKDIVEEKSKKKTAKKKTSKKKD